MKEWEDMSEDERETLLRQLREESVREERRAFLWDAIHNRLLTAEEFSEAKEYGRFLNTSEPFNDDERRELWVEALATQMEFQLEAVIKINNSAK